MEFYNWKRLCRGSAESLHAGFGDRGAFIAMETGNLSMAENLFMTPAKTRPLVPTAREGQRRIHNGGLRVVYEMQKGFVLAKGYQVHLEVTKVVVTVKFEDSSALRQLTRLNELISNNNNNNTFIRPVLNYIH